MVKLFSNSEIIKLKKKERKDGIQKFNANIINNNSNNNSYILQQRNAR